MRLSVPVLFAVIALVVAGAPRTGHAQRHHAPESVEGELLVQYRDVDHRSAVEHHRQALGMTVMNAVNGGRVYRMKAAPGMTTEETVARLRQDDRVAYAEPNYYRFIKRVPNDTQMDVLWGLTRIAAPAAWDVSTDCGSVVVAVLDTGVDYTHPDLAANMWGNPNDAPNGVDEDANGKIDDVRGWDFVHDDNDPMDVNGHGTAVAGIIGAAADNSRGVAGVCWSPKIMPLRVLDSSGTGTVADLVQAMTYARMNGADIINASYAGGSFSQAEYDAIQDLDAQGVLLVAASGNETADNDLAPSYPAGYDLPNILAVAATGSDDSLSTYSNYGATTVHVAAPGDDITSTSLPETTVLATQGFEAGTGGWTLPAPWGLSSTRYDGSWSLSDSPSGNYPNAEDTAAVSPGMDLSGTNGGYIRFHISGWMAGDGDALYLETAPAPGGPWTARPIWLYDGDTFDPVNAVSGSMPTWQAGIVYLEETDTSPTFHARFRMQTNAGGTADGIYIDGVSAVGFAHGGDAYSRGSGTSFSAPYVTGLAALIRGSNPGMSAEELRGRIMDCVDRVPALTGAVLSGGRINAQRSLLNLPAYPIGLAAALGPAGGADVDWAANYSPAITLRIERGESESGPFSEIAAVNATAGPYRDSGLQPGRRYYYRARAQSSGGTSSYSEVVQAAAAVPAGAGGGPGASDAGGGGCFIQALY